jgi:ABC-type nickel/cobalt efflux system permease component RcnA
VPTTQKTNPQLAKRVQKDLADGSSRNNRNSLEVLLALELYGQIIDISADTETTWADRRSSDVVVRLGSEMAYITHENRRAWLICSEGFSVGPLHLCRPGH